LAVYYFDSSAIVKRYVDEAGSDSVEALLADPSNVICASRLTEVEVASAITRRGYGARLSEAAISSNLRVFRMDFAERYWALDVTRELMDQAVSLAREHRLRGYDAMHLATARDLLRQGAAQHLDRLSLVSADAALNAAAEAEGIVALDPTQDA
jgi:predicted nucleic acid-binding protein